MKNNERHYNHRIEPRFSETDALKHTSRKVAPVWFEDARTPIFVPRLEVKQWNLIIAKIELAHLAELFYSSKVEVRTYIMRIGNTSFDVGQEAWQNNEICVQGRATMVYFDYDLRKSIPIAGIVRQYLEGYFE